MCQKHPSGGDTTSKTPSSSVWTWFVNGFVFEKSKGSCKGWKSKTVWAQSFRPEFQQVCCVKLDVWKMKVCEHNFYSFSYIPYTPCCGSFKQRRCSQQRQQATKAKVSGVTPRPELPPITLTFWQWWQVVMMGHSDGDTVGHVDRSCDKSCDISCDRSCDRSWWWWW